MRDKLTLLKTINKLEPNALYSKIYKVCKYTNEINLNTDLKLLKDELYIIEYRDKVGVFTTYELTVKGYDYINTHKESTLRFWIPICISISLSILSIIISIFKPI